MTVLFRREGETTPSELSAPSPSIQVHIYSIWFDRAPAHLFGELVVGQGRCDWSQILRLDLWDAVVATTGGLPFGFLLFLGRLVRAHGTGFIYPVYVVSRPFELGEHVPQPFFVSSNNHRLGVASVRVS